MSIVGKIKELCKERGISFSQFEKESGLGLHTATKWDVNAPSIKKVQIAAEYFGVPVSYLVGDMPQPASDELSSLFASADPWVQQQVLSLLKSAIQAKQTQDTD